ncbi:Inward rectifier potassium channel Irk [Flavobacterium amnicola]|uniref:Inward rectifier potassium channel Irk n=1 Tax=Flavobacterium amnicola TaxID=2506422 RepID=A0A4Q1K1C9_9FLAO|nr:ion channel [Flavobacterium amnicola]RXR17724.1 Inward rectifier potassium channel Irk [Flavobacterium amnicola]
MSVLKKVNKKIKADNQTGFGANAASYGGRFINKNGTANVRKEGIGFIESISWYHTMLNIPRWKFMTIIFIFYLLVNFLFASIYCLIGVEHLNGISADNFIEKFGQAFFFSAQTFTTVGYGHISPTGFLASFVASVEALFGLLSFAIATGLFYGRFSKPKAHIKFSENAIVAPFQEGKALMFRIAPYKNTNLTDAEAKVTLGMKVVENGIEVNRFFSLDLEYDRINALTLSWTLVHPITEDSPLFAFTKNDFQTQKGEVIIYLKAFDEMYSNTVAIRSSYIFKEIVYGAKFIQMFENNDNSKTLLHLDRLNSYTEVVL